MAETEVRGAEKADIDPAAQALGSAFSTDPLFQWIIGSTGPLGDRLRHMFKGLIAAELRKPVVKLARGFVITDSDRF